ncbi:MAG: dihydrolipoyllysine-residue acetyltransferase [Actinomycetota bacterium]|nr:dihydrolipoyllysine-residue acetyltransferase [Actinomycetota bacterium]
MTATGVIDVAVPDIGDFTDIPVIEILVGVGDTVAVDDPLLTLESDKATMNVPAPVAGVVRELRVAIGDKLSEGAVVLTLEPAGSDPLDATLPEVREDAEVNEAPAATPSSQEKAPAGSQDVSEAPEPPTEREPRPPADASTAPVYASPSVRRIARELGADLTAVSGTGRKGRITKEDVERIVASPPATAAPVGAGGLDLAPWPTVDFEKYGPVERGPLSRIQKISARNLARNWAMIPHVTQNDEADVTDLEAFRKRLNEEHARDGVKLTMLGFLVAASVATLKAFPEFNASLDGEELVLKRYYNIGFAADTPQGLVVPVIKNADAKGVLDVARELTTLSGKAREGKLGPAEMAGATFTISSLGGIGGTSFTPIINAPELAILGVSRAAIKPVWNGKDFAPRLMLPLSLSYDHRVIDGAAAARFTVHLAGVLSDLRRALL